MNDHSKTRPGAAAPPRIVIVDPSLRDARGHHFALTQRITKSILHEGFRPVWLCHQDAAPDLSSEAEIEPALSVSLYDAYKQPGPHAILPARLRRTAAALHGLVKTRLARNGLIGKPLAPHEKLAFDLEQAIDRLDLSAADRLLFHTTDGLTYAAIDLVFRRRSDGSLPKVHLCTPYDTAGIMPNRVSDLSIETCIARWHAAGWLDRRLFLYAENRLLAEHLSTLWSAPVRPLELPSIAVDPNRITPPVWPGSWRPDQLKIVHLGPARIEKGFHLLPEIIHHSMAVAEEQGDRSPRPCFAIQCSPQITGYTPQVAAAIGALRAYPASDVHLLERTLDDDSYLSWLASADLVLLPYGKREYGKRSSGIVSEALSLGKAIVAMSDTYPASMIEAGAGATGANPMELGRAIAEIAKTAAAVRASAAIAGERYRTQNDPTLYVAKCLAVEQIPVCPL